MDNQRPSSYLYSSHLLITIGVLFLCIFIFHTISEHISLYLWGIKSSQVEINASPTALGDIYALKLSQLFFGMAFIATSFISIKVFKKRFGDFSNLNNFSSFWLVLGSLVLYFSFLPFNNWILELNQYIPIPENIAQPFRDQEAQSDNIYMALLQHNSGLHLLSNLFIMALVPAISEELLFRGVLFRVFKSWSGNLHASVILTSLFFATLHLQPFKFFPMMALSAMFCYIYYLTGSLWVPMLIHFINNALVVLSDAYEKSGQTAEVLSEDFVFPWYITLGSLIFSALFFWLIWKKSNKKIELAFE
jgi:membrane protease YdiL (CAAX protease family)